MGNVPPVQYQPPPPMDTSGIAYVDINGYLGFVLFFLFFYAVIIVVYYAEPGFPWHTYVTCVIGYYVSFGILLTVPIDIATVIIDRRSQITTLNDPQYMAHVNTISLAYSVFFDIILIMGSVVLVFEEYYNTDGYFTLGGKLASAFYRVCRDMILGVIAGVIILAVILAKKIVSSRAALQLAAIVITNTVYETFLMFLLGYGLVQFPRSLWMQANLDTYLLRTQMKAATDFKSIREAEFAIAMVVADVMVTKDQIAEYADQVLNDAMDIIMSEVPPGFRSKKDGKIAMTKEGQITIDTLADLRLRLNQKKDRFRMSQGAIGETKMLAYQLEDLVKAKNSGEGKIQWTLTGVESTPGEYRWYIIWRPLWLRLLSIGSYVLSAFSLVGVICSMDGVPSEGSLYWIAVHDPRATPSGIASFVLFSLGYATYVAFWALFQIRLAGFMELVPFKTTPESLSFNVRMVARLAAPLAFFYLGWIAENGLDDGFWTKNSAPPYIFWANNTVFNTSQPTMTPTTFAPSSESSILVGSPTMEPVTTESLPPSPSPTLSRMFASSSSSSSSSSLTFRRMLTNDGGGGRRSVRQGRAVVYDEEKLTQEWHRRMPRARSLVLEAFVDWGSMLVDAVMGSMITWTDFGRKNEYIIDSTGSTDRISARMSSSSSASVSKMAMAGFEGNFRKLLRGKQGPGGNEDAASSSDIRLLAAPSLLPSAAPSTLATVPPSPAATNNPSRPPSPTYKPTPGSPSYKPTPLPSSTHAPTHPTPKPSNEPSYKPSRAPTIHPTWSQQPTSRPSKIFVPRHYNVTIYRPVLITIPTGLKMPSCFSHFYQLDQITALRTTFGTLFPIVLFCVMFLIVTNVLNHLLVLIKMGKYQFGAELVTEEQLKEGQKLLEKNKRATARTAQRDALKNRLGKLMLAAGVDRGGGGFISWLFGLGQFERKKHTKLQIDKDKPVLVEPSPLSGMLEKKGTKSFVVVGGGYKTVYGEVRSPGELFLFGDQDEATAHRTQSIRQQNQGTTKKASDEDEDEDNDGDTSTKKKNPFMKGFGALARGLGLPSPEKKKTKKRHDNDDGSPAVDLIEPLLTLKLTLVVSTTIVPSKKGKDGVHLKLELTEETMDLKFKLTEDAERWKEGLDAWKKYALDFTSFYGEGARPMMDDDDDFFASSGQEGYSYSSGLTALEDLDAIDLEVVDLEAEGVLNPLHGGQQPAKKSMFGSLFGGGKKGPDPLMADVDNAAPIVPKPKASHEGWLFKKGSSGAAFGADWHKRYAKINENTCALTYSKTDSVDEEGNLDGPGLTTIDLKTVHSIEPYEKAKGKGSAEEKGKKEGKKHKKEKKKVDLDFQRFNIDTGESEGGKVYKFKANSADEGKVWLKKLQEWRDYAVLADL